jgi:L-alanine-DL-glutamate epimerase-like enolase superfamily enzyme
MRITSVEAIVLRLPTVDTEIADGTQDDLLIRVHTDEGIIGVAEVDSAPEAVRAIIGGRGSHLVGGCFGELLIGEDPLDTERLWWKLYRRSMYFGRRGIGVHALSGIDIALWDIKGQALGKPICEILGTPRHDRVRAYASLLMPYTVPEVKERIAETRAAGFTAVKLGWGPLGSDPVHDVSLVTAAREAAGDDVDILIDAGFGYGADHATATGVAREFEQLGVYLLEEPFEPDEYEAYAELADGVDLRIAAGEEEATRWGLRELLERGHVDVIQPDITRCGGFTEALPIIELAGSHGVDVIPHAWKTGIIKAASLHFNAVLPEAFFLEYCVSQTPLSAGLTRETFAVEEDGFVRVPTGPGLGVDLDLDVVQRYRVDG